jgi:uncharacterized protein Usg
MLVELQEHQKGVQMYLLSKKKVLVSLRVFYYRPDYRNLIQEFAWQTEDYNPRYPRVNKFLNYWKENIDAIIADIEMAEIERKSKYKSVEDIFRF